MYGDKMEKIRFQICEKELTLYPAQGENRPLIVFNTVMGDGEELAQAMRAMDAPDCNLLVVGKLQWYHDMTPWSCPPLSKRGPAATGGADAYLETLASEIVPGSQEKNPGKRAVRRHRRVFAGWAFCALCDVPLRLLRVGGQHVRLPVVSEVPGIRASA